MTSPLYLDKAVPAAYAAATDLAREAGAAAAAAGLDRALVELVNLRVSQLNRCAFCIDLHHRRAVRAGESARRLALLPAWEETELFTDRERAALALAESVTTLPGADRRRRVEDESRAVLGDDAFAAVAWVALTMNAFNRISMTSHHPVR